MCAQGSFMFDIQHPNQINHNPQTASLSSSLLTDFVTLKESLTTTHFFNSSILLFTPALHLKTTHQLLIKHL